jgi:uncharacterized delta-60 repeat protein
MSWTGRQSRVVWKTLVFLALLGAMAALAAGASAAKKGPKKRSSNEAGRLDPKFGKGGKVAVAFPGEQSGEVGVKYDLPYQFTAGRLEMAPAPGGKTLVAGSSKVVRLLANGKLDPSFGGAGAVEVAGPAGQSFVLADVAADSVGRVVVAGTARPLPTSSTPDPLLSSVVVMRFAADGSLDRSFGKDGLLHSDLGIAPPKIGTERYIGPAVGLRSIAVDPQNRVLISGASVSEVCGSSAQSTGFVARLTEAGALDPGFGDGGLREIVDRAALGQAQITPTGTLLTLGLAGRRCQGSRGPEMMLTRFGLEGNLDPSFGFAGFRVIGFGSPPVVSVGPSGRISLLGERRSRRGVSRQLVMRLLPDGGLDPSFGRTGRVVYRLPKGGELTALEEDNKGRLLLAGRVTKPLPRGSFRSTFLVVRIKRKGTIDRSFGRRGSVGTGFGGPASSVATDIMLADRGRFVVGGEITSPRLSTGSGFAIARYLGGR